MKAIDDCLRTLYRHSHFGLNLNYGGRWPPSCSGSLISNEADTSEIEVPQMARLSEYHDGEHLRPLSLDIVGYIQKLKWDLRSATT